MHNSKPPSGAEPLSRVEPNVDHAINEQYG